MRQNKCNSASFKNYIFLFFFELIASICNGEIWATNEKFVNSKYFLDFMYFFFKSCVYSSLCYCLYYGTLVCNCVRMSVCGAMCVCDCLLYSFLVTE